MKVQDDITEKYLCFKVFGPVAMSWFTEGRQEMLSDNASDRISYRSTDSGKDPPGRITNFADNTDSGTSLTFQPSRSECGTPRNSTILPPILINSISQNIQTENKKNADISFTRFRVPTPDGSVYGLDSSIETPAQEKRNLWRKNMTVIFSCIYAIFLVVIGGIIYVNNQSQKTRYISEYFSIFACAIGMLWLLFFHIDLFRYKQKVLRKMMGTSDQIDRISTNTDFNLGITFLGNEIPPYRFLTGRHSGSFYLKAGLAAFCFGHLINEGLQLGQEILNYTQEDRSHFACAERSAIVLHTLKPLYSFYQLFIVFKYSNVIINRYTELARFSVMHIMATCVCFWFGTIVEDALEDYHHKLGDKENKDINKSVFLTSDNALCSYLNNSTNCYCATNAILSINNVQAIPYLYPFTIEFNLLLAGVWFIVWHNIGKEHHRANPHHFHHRIDRNDGIEEVTYQSNLVISADCHAANKGLFAGLFVLMTSVITIIVFFVTMSSKGYQHIGLSIHYFQEGTLNVLTLIGVIIGYKQLSKLDFNKHPITFLDDVLLFIPLPFYFIQSLLTIMAEYQNKKTIRIVMSILIPVQAILQTPLIIDGLRRCSNTQALRYTKPGREIVTFLIVCNLTMWVINTFEAKSVEFHYGQNAYFGEFLWLFISHTTLPLILFYRFHASVCLADIWKSAYEKGE